MCLGLLNLNLFNMQYVSEETGSFHVATQKLHSGHDIRHCNSTPGNYIEESMYHYCYLFSNIDVINKPCTLRMCSITHDNMTECS